MKRLFDMGGFSFIVVTAALLTASSVLLTDFVCYFFLTPTENPSLTTPRRDATIIVHIVMIGSTIISLMRSPFAVVPYVCKATLFFITQGKSHGIWRTSHSIQLVRIVGDVLNLPATLAVARLLIPSPSTFVQFIVALCAAAEVIRLITEKGQMLISAAWQMLPHRQAAVTLRTIAHRWLPIRRYCAYYSLGTPERLAYLMHWLACRSAADPETVQRLTYVKRFHIVPDSHVLGAGHVRDVANGLIFIHESWVNDPWLLIGQALRRGTWLFDPRWLPRPFRYRTEANPLATRFVLMHAGYSPPYAWYQFGHETKVARYQVFYTLLSWLGMQIEKPMLQDGTYAFDSLLMRCAEAFGWSISCASAEPMRSEQQVIAHIIGQTQNGSMPTAQEIADRYSYPLEYVEEVLMPQLAAETSQTHQ